MIITLNERKNNDFKRNLFNKLKIIFLHIHDRCNNPNNEEYKNYGGRGVSYSKSWNTMSGFLNDIDKIPGWDTTRFLNGDIQLDKDIKIPNNKLYCKNNCLWVTRKINMQYQASCKPFYIFNENTFELDKKISVSKFCEDNGLNRTVLINVLNHIKHRVGHWYAWRCDDIIPTVYKYYAFKNGKVYSGNSNQQLSIAMGMNKCYVTNTFRKKESCNVYIGNTHIWKQKIDVAHYLKSFERSNDHRKDQSNNWLDLINK